MKRIFSIALILVVGLQLSCKKNNDPQPSLEETATEALVATWALAGGGTVSVDGSDITSDYSGFSIAFMSAEDIKTFTVINGGKAFPVSFDSWKFTNDDFSSIERGYDGVIMATSIIENQLTLNFSTPEPTTGARVSGLFGVFEFVLTKQ